jgi:hypothetical protein
MTTRWVLGFVVCVGCNKGKESAQPAPAPRPAASSSAISVATSAATSVAAVAPASSAASSAAPVEIVQIADKDPLTRLPAISADGTQIAFPAVDDGENGKFESVVFAKRGDAPGTHTEGEINVLSDVPAGVYTMTGADPKAEKDEEAASRKTVNTRLTAGKFHALPSKQLGGGPVDVDGVTVSVEGGGKDGLPVVKVSVGGKELAGTANLVSDPGAEPLRAAVLRDGAKSLVYLMFQRDSHHADSPSFWVVIPVSL